MNGHWEAKDGLHPARFRADISRGREDRRLLWDAVGSTHHRYCQALVKAPGLFFWKCSVCPFMLFPLGLITTACHS